MGLEMVRFAEERKDEVLLMLRKMASNVHQRKLMHQSLPLHMRRRAMSYNSKRLPRKFRSAHLSQFSKSGVSEKKKRPSRKFRRKPHNLLKEYERRKRTFVWLETHIWHARRFHMAARWGYKVAQTPCNKGYRACYRATSKHCLLHDLSYEGCVEVRGTETALREGLRRLCSERVGLTMAGKAYGAGTRAGYVWLYEDGQYPYGCLGKVRFVWRAGETEDRRTVWIFAHPSLYRKLVEQLVLIFGLKNALRETSECLADITRNPVDIRCPRYRATSQANGEVEVIELKDTLNRFHLTGPLSQATLAKALRLYKPPAEFDPSRSTGTWYSEFVEGVPQAKKILRQQAVYWGANKDRTSPGELSPGEVIGLVVEDPRLNRPQKRTKALPGIPSRYAQLDDNQCPTATVSTSYSPLWDDTIRNRVTEEMKSTHELSHRRSIEALVPGERCATEAYLQPVPILLLQTPGSQDADYKRLGYGAGWDVIVPAGYGLPLWHSLTRWGAKAAGQRELDMMAIESGTDRSAAPDTILGRSESATAHTEALRRYFNRPNNRRVNYTKLSIASPFRCPWTQLVHEWNGTAKGGVDNPQADTFFVLRDKDALAKLRLALDRKFNIRSIGLPPAALVPLLITLKTRGNPGANAILCLPKREDFRANKRNRLDSEHGPVYTEPLRKDPHERERKVLRAQHLRTLKRLRGQRVREKKRRQRANPGVLVRIAAANNGMRVQEQLEEMAELWLPGQPATVRDQCSRECFGYVTQCCFSLSEGKVTGLAYVTVKGLEKLFKICNKGTFKVLIRGTRSRGYRFATLRLANE
ncbi:ribonucleases P/MRP protein subunit POP1 [Anopheles bellator]|uniref:ribonucleases P/MRP protein subunit POP1 n=1 Tax=Anopheles bellator TaxID=139047 RepID=UPI002648FB3D|nr:ribonucleases P/MRP protein subunit POP1 [Anopheles bellator]